jgi:hypothetical protein
VCRGVERCLGWLRVFRGVYRSLEVLGGV